MIITKSRTSSILILIGLSAGIPLRPTVAQTTDTQTTNHVANYRQVTKSCAVETRRFCPALDPAAPQPRGTVICLKPYKSSLSQACRRAVKAATS